MPNAFLMKYLKVVDRQYALKEFREVNRAEIKTHGAFMRLLNIRYVLCPYSLPDSSLKVVVPPQSEGMPAVYEYNGFLPRAFFPGKVMQIQGKEAILSYMAGGFFDPENVALVEEKPPFEIEASDGNRAEIVSWGFQKIEINANVKTPSLLAVSEIYYPAGWKAFVDGRETKIFKTDYVLRSVFLEPGTHKVEMVFKPRLFAVGLTATIASFGVLCLGAAVGLGLARRKRSSPPEIPAA